MNSPFLLTIITFTPIVAAVILFLMPDEGRLDPHKDKERITSLRTAIRCIAAAATFISLSVSLIVYFQVNQAYAAGKTGFFLEDGPWTWVPQIGISYHLGVDGVSAPMVLLTGLASFCGVLISWHIDDRPREFFAFFMLLVAGVYGVFVALDIFQLFFFYELAIFPMYILIATWGWKVSREYAAMKLTLYILVGSVVALVGVIAMYFLVQGAGMTASFDIKDLIAARDAGVFDQPYVTLPAVLGGGMVSFAKAWFPFIFIGFGVLAGIFPFHNWSPDGHVAAPTAVSMIHAGVLMKMGAYAALRVGVMLLPEGAQMHLPWLIGLTLINVVYGSLIAMVQRDFKYVIGFSSVSHMGLVSMGFATMNLTGMTGAGLQMFSHGVMTALFFSCVGMVYDRAHTRDIPSLGGFGHKMPLVAGAFIIGGLVSMGMPGLSGFVAEFPIFVGLWQSAQSLTLPGGQVAWYYAVIAILAVLGIVITAAYVLRVIQRVFFGEFDESKWHDPIGDVTVLDKIALAILVFWLVAIGLYPPIMETMVSAGMKPIALLLGGA
ncbi:MAG: NADH-quinone oxidoreductase subunit M [Anaerolineae bacterium]|nr:NADH-quinone oxidoreductase subunit M [Anaerolineae bacterium]